MVSVTVFVPVKAKACNHQFKRTYYWEVTSGTKKCKYRHKKAYVVRCKKCKYTKKYGDVRDNKGNKIYQPCTFKTIWTHYNSYKKCWEIQKKCKGCGRYEIFYSNKRP